ncbi:MAG: quercetin 2,3-dioxygenase [Gammaproteobacteria bacterium]|nr:MAG: quercetin 2,3-dioxygenase [Gammaproteobacteria bacterium]
MKNYRGVKQIIKGMPASDGDGVQLTRIIGTPYLDQLDPFLLLDAFGSDKPQDYIGGFPAHPHRGFETVTYMLDGKMRHKDSAGNDGVIEAGGVQWMTAGSGIIHSEMPEQEDGLLSGFQLWVNLPASHKMATPKYQEFSKEQIPTEIRDEYCSVTVIAGETSLSTKGVIVNEFVKPIYWDINLKKGGRLIDTIPSEHNAFIYVYEGSVSVEKNNDEKQNLQDSNLEEIRKGDLAILENGEKIRVIANSDSRFLLIAGRPLNEPIERAGPFVMNTKQEIQQAFNDYRLGRLVG